MMLESMGFGVHVLGLSAAPLFIDILIFRQLKPLQALFSQSFISLIYEIGMIVLTLKCFCNP